MSGYVCVDDVFVHVFVGVNGNFMHFDRICVTREGRQLNEITS